MHWHGFRKSYLGFITGCKNLEEEAEVGFIKFGNAFNIRLSFLARRKHALIDNIELCITDKDGANHTFKWIWYSETLYELQAPTGNATMAKQQNAIAINAYKDVLIEKFTLLSRKSG